MDVKQGTDGGPNKAPDLRKRRRKRGRPRTLREIAVEVIGGLVVAGVLATAAWLTHWGGGEDLPQGKLTSPAANSRVGNRFCARAEVQLPDGYVVRFYTRPSSGTGAWAKDGVGGNGPVSITIDHDPQVSYPQAFSFLAVAMPVDVSNAVDIQLHQDAANGSYPGRPLPAGSRVLDERTLTNDPTVPNDSCD